MELTAKQIEKYRDKSIPWLLEKAQEEFNAYIRHRDAPNGIGCCISSGRPLYVPSANAHAGHLYPAGKFSRLRFNEDNVHLQSREQNYFQHGNLITYRQNLIAKIGIERVEALDRIAEDRSPH